MKLPYNICLFFICASSIFGAPLESGYSLAPRASASQDERNRAYLEARNRVINAGVRYLNTPYQYGGITRRGLDCSGFIFLSFKDAIGVNLPRSSSGLYDWSEKITLDRAQPGDLLFFKTDNTGRITHVGLYLGSRQFIHSASSGPNTGVIYSSLDESYWSRTYVGAGRAFPEIPAGYLFNNNAQIADAGKSGLPSAAAASPADTSSERLLVSAAFAPVWSGSFKSGDVIRGFTSHLRLGIDTDSLGTRMLFGLEVRPEYDMTQGAFLLPLTLSWGINDYVRIFAGPIFSFGEESTTGEISWYGTAGVTVAPFLLETKTGEYATYAELAWQSNNSNFLSGLRFSTGIRWTYQVN